MCPPFLTYVLGYKGDPRPGGYNPVSEKFSTAEYLPWGVDSGTNRELDHRAGRISPSLTDMLLNRFY